MAHGTHAVEHEGLSIRNYVLIGAILTVITVVELAASYSSLGAALIPILLVLSGVKFAMVVAYFMHLRFEDGLLTRIFVGSFVLAALILIALISLFWADLPNSIALERAYSGGDVPSTSAPAH